MGRKGYVNGDFFTEDAINIVADNSDAAMELFEALYTAYSKMEEMPDEFWDIFDLDHVYNSVDNAMIEVHRVLQHLGKLPS